MQELKYEEWCEKVHEDLLEVYGEELGEHYWELLTPDVMEAFYYEYKILPTSVSAVIWALE